MTTRPSFRSSSLVLSLLVGIGGCAADLPSELDGSDVNDDLVDEYFEVYSNLTEVDGSANGDYQLAAVVEESRRKTTFSADFLNLGSPDMVRIDANQDNLDTDDRFRDYYSGFFIGTREGDWVASAQFAYDNSERHWAFDQATITPIAGTGDYQVTGRIFKAFDVNESGTEIGYGYESRQESFVLTTTAGVPSLVTQTAYDNYVAKYGVPEPAFHSIGIFAIPMWESYDYNDGESYDSSVSVSNYSGQ